MPEDAEILARLAADGIVCMDAGVARLTRRWHGAMARAALRLRAAGAPWRDLRLPIAVALLERYGALADEELARYVEVVLPMEDPASAVARPAPAR